MQWEKDIIYAIRYKGKHKFDLKREKRSFEELFGRKKNYDKKICSNQ